jgi:ubiquinone/menaquinone biosynthesis C-methylase UbiE
MRKDLWKDIRYRGPHHPVVEAFVTPKLDFIKKHTNTEYPITILDLGCGNGVFTHYFAKIGITVGLDISHSMLKKNPHDLLIQSSALEIPFKKNQFYIAFEANLLHHVDYPLEVIREMRRVSEKYVITIEPNMWNPLMFINCLLTRHERGALRFTQKYVNQLFSESNLRVIAQASMGMIFQNKTPCFLLPYLKRLDYISFWGGYTICISEKRG